MEQKIIDKLDAIIDVTRKKVGIDLSSLRGAFLERRVLFRMRTLEITNFDEYVKLISTSFDEAKLLQKELSINVTKFFRDPFVWDFLQESILPEIVPETRVTSISAWCCACASGEESYSVSMMFDEFLKKSVINYKIYATDISSTAIERAKEGVYGENELVNVSPERLLKYFEKLDNDKFVINSQIKNKINFTQHNMSNMTGQYFDIIFCRNVLIYYTKNSHAELFKSFHKQLKKNGFLVLGQDESMIGTNGNEFFEVIDPKHRVYKKLS